MMKLRIGWIWFILILFAACTGRTGPGEQSDPSQDRLDADSGRVAVLAFEQNTHNFGEMVEGETVAYAFRYRNSGNAELVIRSVASSCGCTVPKYKRSPLAPGQEEMIEVVFDSSGRSGKQMKSITVFSNAANDPVQLTITAEIKTTQ